MPSSPSFLARFFGARLLSRPLVSRVVLLACAWASSAPVRGADHPPKAASGKEKEALPVSQAGRDLTYQKWSGELNVPDPVALTVDPKGRVYVASTARRKAADLDIRYFPEWIPDDVAMRSVEDKAAFLRSALAPGKLRQGRSTFRDHNGDGSVDWKDLTAISERIYQLRDTDGDGVADQITVF
ncbi:MAG: hypothetical protein RLZZ244_2865, partial [Verrucomicrobiota bacterium]